MRLSLPFPHTLLPLPTPRPGLPSPPLWCAPLPRRFSQRPRPGDLLLCVCVQMREPKVQKMIEMSQSRLVRYVFNYNVLEAVSIAISTTILLAGMVGCSL